MLHCAIKSNERHALSFLLQRNVSLTEVNNKGDTALHIAVKKNNIEAVNLLLAKGADTWVRYADGNIPLHLAFEGRTAGLLLENGADPNAQNRQGGTPLHLSIGQCRLEVLDAILKYRANINFNMEDKDGRTPLLLAVSCGNRPCVEALLDAGADVNLCDKHGHTPLWNFEDNLGGRDDTNRLRDLLISRGAVKHGDDG